MGAISTRNGASGKVMSDDSKMISAQVEATAGRLLTASAARLCMDKASHLLGQIKRTTCWKGMSSGQRAVKKLRRRSGATMRPQQRQLERQTQQLGLQQGLHKQARRACGVQNMLGFQAVHEVQAGIGGIGSGSSSSNGAVRISTYAAAKAPRPPHSSTPGQEHGRQGRVMGMRMHGQVWEALGSNPPFS